MALWVCLPQDSVGSGSRRRGSASAWRLVPHLRARPWGSGPSLSRPAAAGSTRPPRDRNASAEARGPEAAAWARRRRAPQEANRAPLEPAGCGSVASVCGAVRAGPEGGDRGEGAPAAAAEGAEAGVRRWGPHPSPRSRISRDLGRYTGCQRPRTTNTCGPGAAAPPPRLTC